MTAHPEVVPWFIGTWIVLGVVGVWFQFFNRNIPQKKRLLPIFTVGSGVLFAVFVFLMIGDVRVLFFIVPAIALIIFLNLRMIKVCESCGRTVTSNVWFSKMEYCSKCGAKLP
jgi:uncharacterized membrane protein